MFKVLVTGAKGQVGSELAKAVLAGFTVFGLGPAELDITNVQQVKASMAQRKPNLIINALPTPQSIMQKAIAIAIAIAIRLLPLMKKRLLC